MYQRNLVWTLDFKNRLWSNHPTEMIVRPDYVILYWESIPGFTQGVKPHSVVITHQCSDLGDGSKIFTFTILDKNTTRRGPRGDRRTIRRPRKVSSTSRVLKYLPSPANNSDGEFFHIPLGSTELEPICGSGLFWHYFRWWITPVDNTIMGGYAKYLPQLYGAFFPNSLYGDPNLCRIDEHFECVDVCELDGSPEPIKLRFGFGDGRIARRSLPPTPSLKIEASNSITDLSNLSSFYPTVKSQIESFYGSCSLSISPIVGDQSKASVFVTAIGSAEFTWYDVNGDETDVVSEICTYHYDHTPIFRVDAYSCVPVEPSDCDGLIPGWYLRVCIEWTFDEAESSLCQSFFLFPPLGIPFEGDEWMVDMLNYLLQILMDKVNDMLRSLLGEVVLVLPPQYRVIGKFILLLFDLFDIRVGAYFFYCPPPSNSSIPSCGDNTYLLTAEPI